MKTSAVLLAPALVAFAFWDALLTLVFGWAGFLARVLPRVTVDGAAIAVAAVATVLLTTGLHLAARRAVRDRATFGGGWRLRWTLAVVLGLFLLFAGGISMVGLAHQAAWLATSDEPATGGAYASRFGRSTTRNELRQISLAVGNYADMYDTLPPGGTFDADGRMMHSWETHLLTWLNYQNPIDLTRPWRDPANERHFRSVIPEFVNPGFRTAAFVDPDGFGLSHYAANGRALPLGRAALRPDAVGGDTLLIGEVNDGFRPWGHPVNVRDPAAGIGSTPDRFGGPPSAGGALFVAADGSVRFFAVGTDTEVLRALASPRTPESR